MKKILLIKYKIMAVAILAWNSDNNNTINKDRYAVKQKMANEKRCVFEKTQETKPWGLW